MVDIAKHPVLKQAHDLCMQIEKLGASPELTAASVAAAELLQAIDAAITTLETNLAGHKEIAGHRGEIMLRQSDTLGQIAAKLGLSEEGVLAFRYREHVLPAIDKLLDSVKYLEAVVDQRNTMLAAKG